MVGGGDKGGGTMVDAMIGATLAQSMSAMKAQPSHGACC